MSTSRRFALLVLLTACSAKAPPAADLRRVRVGDLPLTLALPATAAVRWLPGGAAQVELRPGTRFPQALRIAPGERPLAHPEVRRLGETVELRYTVSERPGGSGGDEAVLEGVLAVGGRSFIVRCVDQSEIGTPDAAWCIEALGTAEGGH